MATPPGNSTPGASTRCTIRHLVDAVCKIRRQKQCATTARIHKAVRQQLQRNVEVEEVLEQLNAATSIGELWRVDNNGVTSYREPPKGTSKEHLKWAGEKHNTTKWPTKDQSGGQFMMGHVKYPVNEHLTQPMSEHLTQRANEHVPWPMTDQLRCATAEPLREHVMEPSRCSMNEAFMWPMAEPMRWPAMNDPMSWPAAEPLRGQPTGELAQQRSAETPSWPMNEPFRRPMNESLAWSMNQSLRGPMAEPLAWHVTEPLRHPMADPLAWSMPEQLRRPMTEPLSWHGNDQLRRSIAEPLGWAVNNPEPFRRTAAEHLNWYAPPDSVRQQPVKEAYAKPVKDTSSSSSSSARNLNNISSSGWPSRETTQAAHTSTKALSRSIMNSQKDSFKETSASTFVCPPVSQTMGVVGTATQNKTRSFSPSTRHANSKFHSNPPPPQLPVSCKNVQNPCAELQRTCKELPRMREDMPRCDVQQRRLQPEGPFLGVAQNPYLASSQSMGEFAMMANNQGFCAPPVVGQYGCPNNRPANLVTTTDPGSLGMNRTHMQHRTSEIAPEIPAIVPVGDACPKAGQQLESSCLRKCSSVLPGSSNGSGDKATPSQSLEKCLPSGTDSLRVSNSISGQVRDEVLKVARSLLEETELPGKSLVPVESGTLRVESSNNFQDGQTIGTARLSSSTPSVIENSNFASLEAQNVLLPELPPVPCSLDMASEQEPLFNSCGDALDTEAELPSSFGICLENCASSGNSSVPSLEKSPAEEKQHSASSAQPATDSTGHLSDTKDTVTENSGPESMNGETSFSEDKTTGEEATIANDDDDVALTFPFLLETQSPCKSQQSPQMPRCKRNLQNKTLSSKRKKFNCGSLTFLISVVIRSAKACDAGKNVSTIRSMRNFILSKYDVASQDLPLLPGRIRLACKRAVQSGRLRRKGHVFTLASSKIRKFSLFTAKDACSRINRLGAKVHGGSTAEQPIICVEAGDGSSADADGNSSGTLAASSSPPHECLLTDMHAPLESNTPQEEESPLRSPIVDEMGTASDPVQPPEGSCPAENDDDAVSVGCALTAASASAPWEPNQVQSNEIPETKSGNTDENIAVDNTDEQSQYHGDMNPKGLIDGLTRFFTPSNKRNSRVSRNTLQRTLELKVKNGASSPKSRILTLVPRRQQQQQQPRPKSIKAASHQAQSSAFFRLEKKKKDGQHRRRTSDGRRREQLYDGLSHFFAVDGKRRSCTLGRCHGSDLSMEGGPFYVRNSMVYLGKKWDMSEKGTEMMGSDVKLSRLAGRVIRSRTRSLSLTGMKETKTTSSAPQSKKQTLGRHGPEESRSLSHLNTCVTTSSADNKRHPPPHTFGTYSTRLSKQSRSDSSESLPCRDRSRSSGTSKTSSSAVSCPPVGRSSGAKGQSSLGDSVVMRSENDVSTICDARFNRSSSSSNVPFDAKDATSTRPPPTSRQLDVVEHCKLPSVESQGTTVSSSSSSSASSSSAFPTTTGKSAMVKLTRLSSNDCSVFLSHGGGGGGGGSCPSEPAPVVVETKCLQNSESSGVKIEGCADTVSATKKEDESLTEHPIVLDAADARRIVRPGMTPSDMILFRKAQKIAAERILVSQELNNFDPCQPTPPLIQFGPYELTALHSSLYPPEFARLPKLFICEFCLKYLKNHCALELHMTKCRQRYPPGNELYRLDNLSVFEVDGSASPIYCQNVCLLARLFLSAKSPMQSNMSPFLFYIATINDATGSHLVGYFAKEKYGLNGSYSLVSLLVLPPYRRKGYGDFLIQLSYLICRLNKSHGSPLRPLSSVASLAFNANWSKTIMEFIKTYWTPEQALTIRDISLRTGIHPADVTSTLSSLQLIDGTKQDIGTALSLDADIVERCVSEWVLPYVNKRLRIDLKLLQGTKSSLQHLLKTSIESEKLSHIVTRKSARKIQRKRIEDDFMSVSGSETTESSGKRTCERHVSGSHGSCSCCSDFETKSRAAKRKNLSASPSSPSKTVRLSSSDCAAWLSGKLTSSIEGSETPGDQSSDPPSSAASDSKAATTGSSHPATNDTSSMSCRGVTGHFSPKSDAQEMLSDKKVMSTSQLVASNVSAGGGNGDRDNTEIVAKTEQGELKAPRVAEKKQTRTVAVQTDAYDSDFSDDDDSSSESSSGSSSSCSSSSSSCCSSTSSSSSEESEAEETPTDAQAQNAKSEVVKSADASEAVVPRAEERSENLLSVENEMSVDASSSSSSGSDERSSSSSTGDSSSVAGTIPESGPSSQPAADCDVPYEEGANNSQPLEYACEVLDRTFVSNGECASDRQSSEPQEQPDGGDDGSRQSVRDADLVLCDPKPASAADGSSHHQLPEEANNIQGNFTQTRVNSGTGNSQGQLACCARKAEVAPRDSFSAAAAVVNDGFQFGSSLSAAGGVPNIGMESPMSVNSCSEMSGCNMERAPSQAYSDCAQVQNNVYGGMENMGASPACGYGVNQSMTQMTSPAGSSQITSPVSNRSFNIASCSPAAGNGSGYGSAVESAVGGGQLTGAAGNHMTGSGTTFKMPVEDTRYVAASSSYNVNGYGTAMASPASVGQCGYVGQYAEQSPGGGQCAVINQNSPNGGLGYTMPTPSPTNSSSRSFNMASPNTNAYHGQPSAPQVYDRSCPSAPVLSYARVLQQQLPGAADAVPWTHFYPPQATGYSLIKFPEQELVPQHAVALPRNLIPNAQPTVAVQQHLTQVNLVPLATKPAKCPGPAASAQGKQHRRCGKSCKSNSACGSSSLSTVRSQTVAPNVTIQPGTNMITSYNVINMNVDYRAQQPQIAAYPSGPYISNAALINDAQQMQSLNIYQHRAIDFPRQPRPHNNVYTATYGYINGAIAQQSFNIMRQQ